MTTNSDLLGLPRGTDTLLRDLVHERAGIFFDEGKTDVMLDKLSPLVVQRGFNSFLDYYYLLKYDEGAAAEWRNVMNAIAVNETYFWREIDQIHALIKTILPAWVARHPHKPLRIWSAACATGEEPLTIAMALDESGWLQRASIEIHASDASSAAIVRAQEGKYRERSFRNLSPERKAKYFQQDSPGTWRASPALRSRIHYSVANLMNDAEIGMFASSTVIYCRNVFIYFSEASISKVARSFWRSMPKPAYLFIGASESLLRLGTDFVLEDVDDAFVYVKEP
jgi:chemotaxis protein methyltransferase CheR